MRSTLNLSEVLIFSNYSNLNPLKFILKFAVEKLVAWAEVPYFPIALLKKKLLCNKLIDVIYYITCFVM